MGSGWASSCLRYDEAFEQAEASNIKGVWVQSNGLQPPHLEACDCINFIQRLDKIIVYLIQLYEGTKTSKTHEIRDFEVFWHCGGVAWEAG